MTDITDVRADSISALPPDEKQRLNFLEGRVEKHLKAFEEVGQALMEIRSKRLYRENYTNFHDYLRDRWDLSRRFGERLINARKTLDHLKQCRIELLPQTESQIRPLTIIKDPNKQQDIWQDLVDSLPPGGKITAAMVKSAVLDYLELKLKKKADDIKRQIDHTPQMREDWKEPYFALVQVLVELKKEGFKTMKKDYVIGGIRQLFKVIED